MRQTTEMTEMCMLAREFPAIQWHTHIWRSSFSGPLKKVLRAGRKEGNELNPSLHGLRVLTSGFSQYSDFLNLRSSYFVVFESTGDKKQFDTEKYLNNERKST